MLAPRFRTQLWALGATLQAEQHTAPLLSLWGPFQKAAVAKQKPQPRTRQGGEEPPFPIAECYGLSVSQ